MFSKVSIIVSIIILFIIFVYLVIYYLPIRIGNLASKKFNEWQQVYGRTETCQMVVDWLKKQLIVKDAGISEDGTIWIEFKNGTEVDISTYPSETL